MTPKIPLARGFRSIALAQLGAALALCARVAPALPAFPGAQGFGSDTVGGRGGQIWEVTNLNDSGPGSLRQACAAPGPRVIVFRVGGTIELSESILIQEPFVTIAGQTAPGDGVLLRGASLIVMTHDVVVRGLRVRVGDGPIGPDPDARDGIASWHPSVPPYNIVIDHCSASWAVDENMSTAFAIHDQTVQWCLLSEGLSRSIHPEGEHSKAFLVGDHAHRISLHHNLFAHHVDRHPELTGDTETELINNVIYNWKSRGTAVNDPNGSGAAAANIVGNYYKAGPAQGLFGVTIEVTTNLGTRLFLQDNLSPTRTDPSQDDWLVVLGLPIYRSDTPVVEPSGVDVQPALEAYESVLQSAGAILPGRDPVDLRVVDSVRNGTGQIIDSQSEVGGWPDLQSGTAPEDADHDGMPDSWEQSYGLDPNDPSDGPLDRDHDGYTNVEEYLNCLFLDCDAPPMEDGGTDADSADSDATRDVGSDPDASGPQPDSPSDSEARIEPDGGAADGGDEQADTPDATAEAPDDGSVGGGPAGGRASGTASGCDCRSHSQSRATGWEFGVPCLLWLFYRGRRSQRAAGVARFRGR